MPGLALNPPGAPVSLDAGQSANLFSAFQRVPLGRRNKDSWAGAWPLCSTLFRRCGDAGWAGATGRVAAGVAGRVTTGWCGVGRPLMAG